MDYGWTLGKKGNLCLRLTSALWPEVIKSKNWLFSNLLKASESIHVVVIFFPWICGTPKLNVCGLVWKRWVLTSSSSFTNVDWATWWDHNYYDEARSWKDALRYSMSSEAMGNQERLVNLSKQRKFGSLSWWLRWYRILLQCRRSRFQPWVRKTVWRSEWQPTPMFLLGKFHEQRSLASYSSWGCKELDTTEQLTLSFLSKKI